MITLLERNFHHFLSWIMDESRLHLTLMHAQLGESNQLADLSRKIEGPLLAG